MLKKAATQSLKAQTEKLKERLDKKLVEAEDLVKTTGMPGGIPTPPESVLENLIKECDDHTFWLNFRKAAPMLFCGMVEHSADIHNKFHVGQDGLTGYRRLKRKMYKGLEFPFGEPVLFRIAGNIAGGNMQSRFSRDSTLGKC